MTPDALTFDANGLIPAVVQAAETGECLMVAWMNRDAVERTLATGLTHFWSRSRGKLWRKGEESGYVQRVVELRMDCDSDAILLRVEQAGGIACHTGRERCFFHKLEQGRWVETDPVLRDPALIYGKK